MNGRSGKSGNWRLLLLPHAHVLLIVYFLILEQVNGEPSKRKCPGLSFKGELICTSSENQTNICKDPQSVGTIAKYKCNPYFVLYDATLHSFGNRDSKNEGVLRCNPDGVWLGFEQFKNLRCKEECGRRRSALKPYITHGVFTNSSAWPWHAALFRRKGEKSHYICGGTVIRRSAILLAAHCIIPTARTTDPALDSLVVVLGAISSDFNENLAATDDVQIFNVTKSFVVDSYDPRKDFQGDIAILELSRNIAYNDRVSPACLPTDFLLDTNAVRHGQSGEIVGFGLTENGEPSRTLKEGRVEIQSYSECFVKLRQTLSESQLCAGGRTEEGWVTVCSGDSGGGLFIPSPIDTRFYIHGIVSTGDSNARRGQCQNYGVFTRVFSFIPWIRQVLEGLSESLATTQDLVPSPGLGINFVQHGNESSGRLTKFTPIPLEWKNKVQSVDLAHISIEPQLLLNSLEHSKTVEDIKLSQVALTRSFPKVVTPVRLPRLKSIYMDILDAEVDRVYSSTLRFPHQSKFKNFIRSLKFFEKDVGVDAAGAKDISRIASNGVNVFIGLGLFKLIQVDHLAGKIFLSHVDFAPQILSNVLTDSFRLRSLALSSCPIQVSSLRSQVGQLKTLVLDQVTSIGQEDLDVLIKSTAELETLVVVSPRSAPSLVIRVESLPRSLTHLALTRALLKFDQLTSTNMSQVTTFFCESCLSTPFADLNSIFPNLKQLVIKLPQLPTSPAELLKNFQQLEAANFMASTSRGVQGLKVLKVSGNWVPAPPPRHQNWDLEEKHLIFSNNQLENFWSSEADHACSARLSARERSAYDTGTYKFKGVLDPVKVESFSLETNGFSSIPPKIQSLLEFVELEDAVLTTRVMANSFKFCPHLRILRLTNVQIPDMVLWQSFSFPKLEEYRIQTTLPNLFLFFGYHGFHRSADLGFLLLYIPDEKTNPGFNARTALLRSQLKTIHMQVGPCIMLSWNTSIGSLTSVSGFTNQWLKSGSSVPIRKLSLKYQPLEPEGVPSTVTHLNLNFVVSKKRDTSAILKKLSALKDLRFVNVREGANGGNLVEWEWATLNLGHLARHSKSIQYLAIERAFLTNYKEGIQFTALTFLYIETCKYEPEFETNFISIFPNLKKLVIMGSSADKILWRILNGNTSNSLEWVFSRAIWPGNVQLGKFLQSFGIQNNREEYFILKRLEDGSWARGNSSGDAGKIKLQLLRLKGTAEFGVDPRCHGYNLDGLVAPGFWGVRGYVPGRPRLALNALRPFLPKSVTSVIGNWFNSDN